MLNTIMVCVLIQTLSVTVSGTVDINLPELEYISDHLSSEECRQLVAALHTRGYKLNSRFAETVSKVPRDVSCLNMLVHWNSRAGEGKGQTHSILSRRLKQIERRDLADWLSRTSFHQLAQDLDHTVLRAAGERPTDKGPVRQPRRNHGDIVPNLAPPSRRANRMPSADVDSSTPQTADRAMAEPCADPANDTDTDCAESGGTTFWKMLTDTNDDNYVWNMIDLVGFALLVFVSSVVCCAIAWYLCRNRCRCRNETKDRVYGCHCGQGEMGTGPREDSRGGGDSQAYQVNELPAKKKKRKKKQSNKSMVCKTVEYRTDGTVEEKQILLSDASESDFEHAVDIVAGRRHDNVVDLAQEPPPPPRNGKRRRQNEAGQREANGTPPQRRPDTVDGSLESYEMQEIADKGSGSYDSRGGNDRREGGERKGSDERRGSDGRRGSDDRRRTSDDRRQNINDERRRYGKDGQWGDERLEGEPVRDPCWDCNQ